MSKPEKMVPEVRFKGFTEDWEQRKLGEIANFSKGSGYSKRDLMDSGTPIVLYGRLYTKYETIINDINTFSAIKKNTVLSAGEEVIVPASGESAEDIARASVIDVSGIILGGDLNIIQLRESVEPVFLALIISYGKQRKELVKRAQGNSVVHLYNSSLKKINLLFPNKEEQIKIGLFFKKIDDTIALHQRKLDALKELKQGYLESMFPQKGAIVPKLRFTDFDEKWEQCKLKDIADINPKSQLPNKFNYVDLESVIGIELISYRIEYKVSAPSRAQRLAKKNDLFYQTVRPYQKNNYLFEKDSRDFVFSTGYAQIRSDLNGQFLLGTMQTRKFVNNVLARCTGTSYPAINSKDLSKINFMIPINVEEQNLIGDLFSNLNNTITLHQSKVAKLKSLKQSFLQKLFI